MRAPLVTIAVLCALAAPARAHGLRTAYVEVTEVSPGRAIAHLRLTSMDPSLAVRVEGCAVSPTGDGTSAYDRTSLVECPGALRGHAIGLDGLGPIVGEAVVSVAFVDGDATTGLVRAGAPAFELAAAPPGRLAVARQFVGLGLEHIATGWDHLLFLLLLVLWLGDWRSVLLAESAFTVSHSLSFSATALGWIHVSPTAAEACIALSLVMLAAEIDVRATPTRWRGALVALAFGLVHGLGFAGGLREIGVPEHAIAPALLGFGAGIELGQVAFLAIVLSLLYAVRGTRVLPRVRILAVYAIGGISAYWLLVRAVDCVS
jgi:hypothetical protein